MVELEDLIQRYRGIFLINGNPGKWNKQINYGSRDCPYQNHRSLTDKVLEGMLRQEYWLGSVISDDGINNQFRIDLDCKSKQGLALRNNYYWEIRNLLGLDCEPLV
jgi:hypothetical protein